jgi:hypothetical protein
MLGFVFGGGVEKMGWRGKQEQLKKGFLRAHQLSSSLFQTEPHLPCIFEKSDLSISELPGAGPAPWSSLKKSVIMVVAYTHLPEIEIQLQLWPDMTWVCEVDQEEDDHCCCLTPEILPIFSPSQEWAWIQAKPGPLP